MVFDFVIAGVFLILKGQPWGSCSLLLGLAIPVAIIKLTRGTHLKPDRNGFEFNPGTKPWRLNWNDVDSFYVKKIYGNKMIGINFSPSFNKMNAGRKIAFMVSGMEGAINSEFRLAPEKGCDHLNEWKANYG